MSDKAEIKKEENHDSSAILTISQEDKEAFKREKDDEIRRMIASLQDWREQSLKSTILF